MQTHRNTIAGLLKEETGLPYQTCLGYVIKASETNRLPKKLDQEGITRSVAIVRDMMSGNELVMTPKKVARGQVVGVCSSGGVSGSHELSLIMAAKLAELGSVCLLDVDCERSGIGFHIGASNLPVMRDHQEYGYNPTVEESLFDSDRLPGVRTLTTSYAAASESGRNTMGIESYLRILQELRYMFDYIVIDAPDVVSHKEFAERVALGESNYVITAVNHTLRSLFSADSWLWSVLQQGGHLEELVKNRTGYVVCDSEYDQEWSEETVREEMGDWRFLGSVSREDIRSLGGGLLDYKTGGSKIRDLANRIRSFVKGSD